MDKIRDFPRWLPNCREYWHFSRLPGSLTQGTDRVRLMQGFVPERSFTKDRRVRHRHAHRFRADGLRHQCYRQITDFRRVRQPAGHGSGHGAGRVSQHADTVDSLTLMAKKIMPRLKESKQPEAAQNAAAQVT